MRGKDSEVGCVRGYVAGGFEDANDFAVKPVEEGNAIWDVNNAV